MSRGKTSPTRTAARIAWRETRASSGRFIFVILAVAAGVGALTGVRGFSRAFHTLLTRDARGFMAADLTVRTFQLPSPPQTETMDRLVGRGIRRTQITETLTMAAPTGESIPVLISVKAVDPDVYPFYGEVKLNPPLNFKTALQPDAVVVADGVLLRMNAKVGDSVRIGGQPFRIVAEITNEPDRMTGSLNVGPRVMISRVGLDRTGLIVPGSRAAERFLFKVPPTIPILQVRNELKAVFKEGMIADYSEAHPLIEQGLRQSTTFLSLVSLVALVIGALGVATAIQAHLQQKMDSIAVMKCLGAKSSQILRIYILQTMGLGLVGSALGIAVGSLVQLVFPVFLEKYFHLTSVPRFDPLSAFQGLLVGVLTVLLFTIPPLVGIRYIRPAVIFRREMAGPPQTMKQRLQKATAPAIASLCILVFVGLLAAWLSDNARTGQYFAFGIAAAMLALAGVAWILLRGLRVLGRHLPRAAGPVVRQGIANLYRPGNHAGAAVMALGVGVMFTVTVWIVQRGLLKDIIQTAPPGMPNVYLLDITTANKEGVYNLLKRQTGIEGDPEMLAAVSAQIQSIDGVVLQREKLQGMARRFSRTVTVSTAPEKPRFTAVLAGEWWPAGTHPAQPLISVSESVGKVLNIKVGSVIVWNTPLRSITSRVVALHKSESVRLTARVEFFFTPGALDGLPAIYYGGVRAKPASVPPLQKALYTAYPTVTVVNMAEVLDTIQSIVDQISVVVRFISFFSILAGAVILASSVAGTRFRRIREVIILKTLGATRARIARIFSVEFLVIGTVTGVHIRDEFLSEGRFDLTRVRPMARLGYKDYAEIDRLVSLERPD